MLDPRLRRFGLRSVRFPLGAGILRLVVPDSAAWRRSGAWVGGVRHGGEPPYWCEIWPSAAAIARLWRRLGSLEGARVLDLGCGLGLPGIAAARQGAAVTFFDRQADALSFAEWNARRLGAPTSRVDSVCGQFGEAIPSSPFGLIAMADVTYRRSAHAALLQQLDGALAADGVIVHADPLRDESAAFLDDLELRFAVRRFVRRTALGERSVDVRIAIAARTADVAEGVVGRVSL